MKTFLFTINREIQYEVTVKAKNKEEAGDKIASKTADDEEILEETEEIVSVEELS